MMYIKVPTYFAQVQEFRTPNLKFVKVQYITTPISFISRIQQLNSKCQFVDIVKRSLSTIHYNIL